MRVLILVPDLKMMGGVSTFFNSVKEHFSQHQVVYFTRGTRANTPGIFQLLIKIIDYPRFAWTLITGSYDLVHVNSSLGRKNLIRDPLFVLIAKLFRKKVFLFFHGWQKQSITNFTRPLLNLYLKANAIAVLAKEFKSDLHGWGYQGPTYILNTVVSKELEKYFDNFQQREISNQVTILFLSRIEIAKGIYEAIRAYELCRQKTDLELKLIIAGDGSEMERVRAFVESHHIENIEFCGFVSGKDKADVLMKSDIYLFPSYEEGMPISVIEAMMSGLPVVTRYTGALNDFFDGQTMGRITASKDPEVFADMLYELISDPRTITMISVFNNSYAKQNFTAKRFVDRLEGIYIQV